MWKCTNCNHLDFAPAKPEHCPVCGVDAERLVEHSIPAIKGTITPENLKAGFIAESQAHQRNLAFALKAEQEGYAAIAKLFRAIAEAEAVHAFHHLRLLGGVSDTQSNLESAFERENLAARTYPRFIKDANEEGNASVARIFTYSRDVEAGHAKLYKKALEHMVRETDTDYYVCSICGYVSDGDLPEECPICKASKEKFKRIA
ncbi:MAG: rubrerythrin family protein [Dehalococcoidia bacterium]|nr:rubrerythrin family protein [Dehalococcoidia bacterium]